MESLVLPWPPSVNHYWRHVGNRVLISRKGRAYRYEAALALVAAGRPRIEGRLALWVDAYPPDRRVRDLDNVLKALLDALQQGGLYESDSQIDDLRIVRRTLITGGRVLVTARSL